IEPLRTVAVNAQMAGTLLQVTVEEGSAVRAGTVLARIDDREIQAQLRAAEASLELARSAFERAERLRDRQVITQAEYDAERAGLAAAEAQADQLSTRASYAVIRAPLDGVVTERTVQTGDVVGNQGRMFTLSDLSVLVVRVGVSELDVVNIAEGDSVDLTLDAFPNRPLQGRVRRVFPSADPATRLVPVEVALNAEAETLARPGFLARATFSVGLLEDVLLLPAGAMASAAASPSVFVVDGDRVRRRAVRTGLSSQGMVQVLEGLEEGELVVTQGVSRLREGAQVRISGEAT
ncbi:MAG: efflux RND transporter periplasmic adaptor subunit, partial [Longimicrobiales bacterium]|nr:efflux RND transporter periplasmic adaptor subunit [Longimicrobiales bacterium]